MPPRYDLLVKNSSSRYPWSGCTRSDLSSSADDRCEVASDHVQRALGHRSAGFTLSVYGHLFEEHLDELASALDGTSRGTGAVQSIMSLAENGPLTCSGGGTRTHNPTNQQSVCECTRTSADVRRCSVRPAHSHLSSADLRRRTSTSWDDCGQTVARRAAREPNRMRSRNASKPLCSLEASPAE